MNLEKCGYLELFDIKCVDFYKFRHLRLVYLLYYTNIKNAKLYLSVCLFFYIPIDASVIFAILPFYIIIGLHIPAVISISLTDRYLILNYIGEY